MKKKKNCPRKKGWAKSSWKGRVSQKKIEKRNDLKNLNLDSDTSNIIENVDNLVAVNKRARSECGNYLF